MYMPFKWYKKEYINDGLYRLINDHKMVQNIRNYHLKKFTENIRHNSFVHVSNAILHDNKETITIEFINNIIIGYYDDSQSLQQFQSTIEITLLIYRQTIQLLKFEL